MMAEKGGYTDGDGDGDGPEPDGDGDGGKADGEPSRTGPPAGHAGASHKADRGVCPAVSLSVQNAQARPPQEDAAGRQDGL